MLLPALRLAAAALHVWRPETILTIAYEFAEEQKAWKCWTLDRELCSAFSDDGESSSKGSHGEEQIEPAWLRRWRCLSEFGLSAQFSCFSQLTACSLKGHLCNCVNTVLSDPFTIVCCSVNSIHRGGSSHRSTSFICFIRWVILTL